MAESLSTLQTRRDELQKAIDSGVFSVRHGDTSVQYQSLKDMLEALALLDARIAAIDSAQKVRTIRFNSRSGW